MSFILIYSHFVGILVG